MAQFVEALRGFDSLWGHWDVSMTLSFLPHYGPGEDLAPDRVMCWRGGLDGRLVGLHVPTV